MRAAVALVPLLALVWGTGLHAEPSRRATPPTPRAPPTGIPTPMAMGRVRVDVRASKLLITTDLTLPDPRGPTPDMDLHVAYGAPGVPLAFDAQLIETPPGYLVAPAGTVGLMLAHDTSVRAPPWAAVVVGRPQMAGQLVHLPADLLRQALRATGRATLRLREVHELPPLLVDASREVVVRLASSQGKPLAMGLLEFSSEDATPRVEARFCGMDGERGELFVSSASARRPGTAPPLAERGLHDDLCMRFGKENGRHAQAR